MHLGWLQTRSRTLTRVSLIVLLAGLSLLCLEPPDVSPLPRSRSSPGLSRASYDWLHRLSSPWLPQVGDEPVTIVYLDADSHTTLQQDPAKLWDRALHARLLRRLTEAGAKVVVFDILFSDPGPSAEADEDFARAMREHGGVILGADINQSGQNTGRMEKVDAHALFLPHARFLEAAAGWGAVNVSVDQDLVARRHFGGLRSEGWPSLATAAARLMQGKSGPGVPIPGDRRWIRYYGRPFTISHVSYAYALDPKGAALGTFTNRCVFIGARHLPSPFQQRQDEFRSPFTGWNDSQPFLSGVEVHATQYLNLLRSDWLVGPTRTAEALGLTISAVVCGLVVFRRRPVQSAAWTVGLEMAVVGGSLYAFVAVGFWYSWLIIAGVQLPVALAGSFLHQSVEWYLERRRMEAARREAAQRIKEQAALIDKAQDAILVTDLERRLTYANASALRLYGWAWAELEHHDPMRTIFAGAEAELTEAWEQTRQRGEWNGDMKQATRDGQTIQAETRWTLIRDEADRPRSVLVISTDVSEKRRLEAQALRTQRMETIGALAGGMAHDLNNALAPVLMGIQLLRRRPQDEEARRMLALMELSTHRGADLVKQVLLFSRGRESERERLDPAQLLREMEHTIRQTFVKSIRVATMIPPDLWWVQANHTQLHQVLLNLCVNARDAMPQGGDLLLAADNVEIDVEEAGQYAGGKPGAYVMLLVSDTGTGIPEPIRERIFEPFFTTKPEGAGTGLGLSTTVRIVQRHGGFLHLKSEVGAGTTFEIYLPKATGIAEARADEEQAVDLPRGQQELILFADDDRSAREMIGSSLRDHGYRVVVAADGGEARQLLQAHGNELRLALLDTDMPVLDGPGVLALMRQSGQELPVILMSGDLAAGGAESRRTDGAAAFLAKPFRLEDLLSAIRTHLRPTSPAVIGGDSGASPLAGAGQDVERL